MGTQPACLRRSRKAWQSARRGQPGCREIRRCSSTPSSTSSDILSSSGGLPCCRTPLSENPIRETRTNTRDRLSFDLPPCLLSPGDHHGYRSKREESHGLVAQVYGLPSV